VPEEIGRKDAQSVDIVKSKKVSVQQMIQNLRMCTIVYGSLCQLSDALIPITYHTSCSLMGGLFIIVSRALGHI